METREQIIATFKAKVLANFSAELDAFVDELVDATTTYINAKHTDDITKSVLGKRKKYAETEEVMAERGMTLDEIRIHNAYSDGYNARGRKLRKALLGLSDEEVVDEIVTPVVEPTPEEQAPAPEEPVG